MTTIKQLFAKKPASDVKDVTITGWVRTTVFRHRKSALAKIKQYLEGKADDEYR